MLQPVSSFAMEALLCRSEKGHPGRAPALLSGGSLPPFSYDQFSPPIGTFLGCPSAFLPPQVSSIRQQQPQPWVTGLHLASPITMETSNGVYNSNSGTLPGNRGLWTPGIAAWLQMQQQVALLFQQHQQDLLEKMPLPCPPKLEAKFCSENNSADVGWPSDACHLAQLPSKYDYPLITDLKVRTDCLSSHNRPVSNIIADATSSPVSKHFRPQVKSTAGSIADDSSSLGHSPTKKRQRSGFQDGVTVGYTYDAFFVSDGRSKRRNISQITPNLSETPTVQESLTPTTTSPAVTPTEGRQRYTCSECGKDYATSSNLSRHKQTHRSLDSKLAKKCPHCDKIYVSMPALSMHVLTHDLKHQCNVCGKAFSRPWLLQGHLRAHTGEKPYGCAHCGRAFADRSNLRAHMQTHSMMKQFECKKCGKSFALKSYLNKHIEAGCMSFPNSSLCSPTYSVSDLHESQN